MLLRIELDTAEGISERSKRALDELDLYRGHLVKVKWEKEADVKEAQNLTATQALLIFDWKMKIKSCAYRQSQSAWFAQRGLSLHGAMLLMKPAPGLEAHQTQDGTLDDDDLQMFFVDILSDDTTQDGQATLCCLEETLKIIKKKFPHLTEVIVRADGAGCYKSKMTRLAAMSLGM